MDFGRKIDPLGRRPSASAKEAGEEYVEVHLEGAEGAKRIKNRLIAAQRSKELAINYREHHRVIGFCLMGKRFLSHLNLKMDW